MSQFIKFYFTSSMLNLFSDINTSITRSLRLFYCITTLVVCSCFKVCWSFGVVGLGWYLCGRLKHSLVSFTSSMLNMFQTLIHPSPGACYFSIVSPHWSCVLVSMCVGVSVWLGWGGICVAG